MDTGYRTYCENPSPNSIKCSNWHEKFCLGPPRFAIMVFASDETQSSQRGFPNFSAELGTAAHIDAGELDQY